MRIIFSVLAATCLLCVDAARADEATASKLVAAALALQDPGVEYVSDYQVIAYPMGDVAKNKGVCSDVVIRAYRGVGIDLQRLVHEDMERDFKAYPRLWGMKGPDANIDHRRVPNLAVFFTRHGQSLPITNNAGDYKPGDLVIWNLKKVGSLPHIGIVTDRRAPGADRLMMMHNMGSGQVVQDMLFDYTITGHYRYALDAARPAVAITIDDGPKTEPTPLMTSPERNAAIIKALTDRGVRAAFFITSGNGANTPEGLDLLKALGAAGMLIGNHTVTHPDFNSDKVTLKNIEEEVLTCDALIRPIPGYRKWLRFPYLHEGRAPAKVEAIRRFLKKEGYRDAYVTLDTSDWQFAMRLTRKLLADPKLELAPYRAAYLAHVKQRALAYQELSRKLLGRDIPQILLIHHSLLNALFLGDVLEQFKSMGWDFVDPDVAYQDEVFQHAPGKTVTGQSLLLSIARSKGFDLAPYARLWDDADFEMKELDKRGL